MTDRQMQQTWVNGGVVRNDIMIWWRGKGKTYQVGIWGFEVSEGWHEIERRMSVLNSYTVLRTPVIAFPMPRPVPGPIMAGLR